MRPGSEVKRFQKLGSQFPFNSYEGEHCENRKNDVLGFVFKLDSQCGDGSGKVDGSGADGPCSRSNCYWWKCNHWYALKQNNGVAGNPR